MPELLVAQVLPYVIQAMGALGISSTAIIASAVAISTGIAYLAVGAAAYLASTAFAPPKPEAPKPEDGKYNLKQSVPPLVYVLGKVKKAGDYAFLEEKGGTAYHITVWAAHHIKGFTEHWLHDEQVTLDGSGFVTAPSHFGSKVRLFWRLGDAASTAYSHIVSAFPTIWTNDHRGDGLATVAMNVQSVAAEDLQKVFPFGMPQHQAVGEGHDRLIDPRTGTAGYSTNLAIFRYWHLTHPVGGKLTRDDMYDADWGSAADVCDENVTNRAGGVEKRYHGGLWFRANNDPVQIGRLMDQAAELVIYERADGKVGVHPGEYVEPDVRLTANDIISLSYDPNKRKATSVLAVRGRYTDPNKGWVTADAAIYGVPYPTDDERTKTVDNQAVQKHNHMARLQKLAYIRANGPRVRIVAHYEPARNVPYRRFVRVHLPPKLTEAVIEITGRPALSLRNLTYEFEGIVVPAALYDFNAATEEGVPGENALPVEREDVPVPVDFTVIIDHEAVSGGSLAAFGAASVAFQNNAFQYELEWQPTSGGTTSSVLGGAGEIELRSSYLADGVGYRFRSRTWSGGTSSAWTNYIILTVTADPNPPDVVHTVSATGGVGEIDIDWIAPNSANYVATRIYLNSADDFGTATLVATEFGAPSATDGRVVIGLAAGTYYGWLVAINGSGVEASPVATGAVTVT